jgi:hypothetical protein
LNRNWQILQDCAKLLFARPPFASYISPSLVRHGLAVWT